MDQVETQVYALSEKVNLQQGQINTLFKFFEELKDSGHSIAQDIKSIRSDIHDAIKAVAKVEGLIDTVKSNTSDIKDLNEAKNKLFGVILFIGCLLPLIDIAVRFLVHA